MTGFITNNDITLEPIDFYGSDGGVEEAYVVFTVILSGASLSFMASFKARNNIISL